MRRLNSLIRRRLHIDPASLAGAARALIATGWILAVTFLLLLAVPHFSIERALGSLAGFAITVLAAAAALVLVAVVRRGPIRLWWGSLLTASAISFVFAGAVPALAVAGIVAVVLTGAVLVGAGARRIGRSTLHTVIAVSGAVLLMAVAVFFLVAGWPDSAQRTWQPQQVSTLDLNDPAQAGPFEVSVINYGSGDDRHRARFGAHADLVTERVDGSKLVDGWSGAAGWARTRYWGFDAEALPLQGQVWMPEGDGPFPIVLMVHGNHDMEDFSDQGYAYLGELFASRGVIAVSVDENFFNSSFADLLGGFDGGLDTENDARGWLLLEHLRQFRRWNETPGHVFTDKVDLDRVVLIGHSRGGEAVAEATLFNRLPFYPDDGRVAFDYGFGIRGIIAIAPIDGQYNPRDRDTALVDVNYFVIHGSHDGDVQSFAGAPQYSRVEFDRCGTCFKAGMYVVGANHGQFNTVWGRTDAGPPWSWLLNLEPIMDAEAQRRIAKAAFSAFLEAVLLDRAEFRGFFENPASARAWLGDVQFVNQYADAQRVVIADYEEDDDLSTATRSGGHITSHDLSRWREVEVALKWDDLDSAAVVIGWERDEGGAAPEYRMVFDEPLPLSKHIEFALAMSDGSPLEDEAAEWETPASLDFNVVLTDASGHSAGVALSSVQLLYAPVSVETRKLGVLDDLDTSEPVFQHYALPIAAFGALDATALRSIGLRFDVSPVGLIYFDEVAIK